MSIFTAAELEELRRAAKAKAYQQKNKERIAARKHAHYLAHKEEYAARKRAYREANLDKVRQQERACYEAHREEIAARRKKRKERKNNDI